MYRKRPFIAGFSELGSGYTIDPGSYKPFSYYVLGGIDISGEHLRMDAQTEHDDDSFCNDFLSADDSDTSSMSPYNPRSSAFDMVEVSGVGAYEEYIKQRDARATQQDTPKTE